MIERFRRRARGPGPLAALHLASCLSLLLASGCGGEDPGGAWSVGTPGVRVAHPGRDVVLVVLDTLRVDRLGFLGGLREPAPFLAELSERAVVFERAYSTSSWTAPAMASVFSGLYPTRHHVVRSLFAWRPQQEQLEREQRAFLELDQLSASQPLLTERFRDAGYATFGAAANPNISERLGFERGFERFHANDDANAAELLGFVDGWADEIEGSQRPVFLYLHLNDLHHPYERHAPWFQPSAVGLASVKSAYDSEISYVDQQLSHLFERFRWMKDALVVVASDHGEEFRDHGRMGHEGGLYGELNRVLLMFAGPGIVPGRVTVNVSLVDLVPTFIDLCAFGGAADGEAASPGATSLAGLSLAPLLRGEKPRAGSPFRSRTLYAHRVNDAHDPRPAWAAMQGSWKLLQRQDEENGEQSLFSLADDPLDRTDLRRHQSARAEALGLALAAHQAESVPPSQPPAVIELDAEDVEMLERLGYAEGPAAALDAAEAGP